MSFLGYLHNATTLLFGVFASAIFLGIKFKKRTLLILSTFFGVLSGAVLLSYILFSEGVTEKIYPLIIHLPLILLFIFYHKYKISEAITAVMTAYLCCHISDLMGLLVTLFSDKEWLYYSVRIATTIAVFVVLMRYVSVPLKQIMKKPSRPAFPIIFIPVIYYLFDYVTTVYTDLLYSESGIVTEFVSFLLCVAYLLFMPYYFKQYNESYDIQRRNNLIEMQYMHSQKELESMQRAQKSITIIRHDMRHFLTGLASYIDNGEYEKAQSYINEVISIADSTAIHKHCKNDLINMILSSYDGRMKENQIDLRYSVQVPESLPFKDVDLTSILSNSLENALKAVSDLPVNRRIIDVDIRMRGQKLLISVKNTFSKMPRIVDGLPRAEQNDHGLGTQSIQFVAEKLKGNCHFSVQDDMFVLRVIL